jgi:hypothetical protein
MSRETLAGLEPDQAETTGAKDTCSGVLNSPHPDVDVSLIDYLLTLTPTERLLRHEQALVFVEEFRKAGREYYGFDPRDLVEANQPSS